jgi:parallel beta-helix repeat protein
MELPAPVADQRQPPVGSRLLQVGARAGHEATACFPTIQAAAEVAQPGDTILISPGIYREHVAPPRGGAPGRPLVFRAEIPGKAIIRGSDPHHGPWRRESGALYRTRLDPLLLSRPDNPFAIRAKRLPGRKCLGQVFVDGLPFTELDDAAAVRACPGTWTRLGDPGELLLHFHDDLVSPEERLVELSVRGRCFAPHLPGLSHIHLIGLVFEHCANQFPSGFWKKQETFDGGAPQAAAVGTRRGHHWTIRHCVIRHANAIGLDCGMEGNFGEDPLTRQDAANVGHHLIENNVVTDNGACGIAGAGQCGTRVLGNRIERNNTRGWTAPETGGIKFHFFYDGLIAGNLLRDNDCSGIWLDNQWYGTRVTRNVCLNNHGSGIFIEMGDGSCSVDHNVCAYTHCGEGIYLHDSSGVSVMHNLLYANAHFGLFARIVTERQVRAEAGSVIIVGCARLNIQRNLFVDNYRGQLCLPPPDAPRCDGNHADENLYLQGFQWQWQGAADAEFGLTDNDGRLSADADRFAGLLGFQQWQDRTGYDRASICRILRPGVVENGAVEKGGLHLSTRALRLEIRDLEALGAPAITPPPGPFAQLTPVIVLWPLPMETIA